MDKTVEENFTLTNQCENCAFFCATLGIRRCELYNPPKEFYNNSLVSTWIIPTDRKCEYLLYIETAQQILRDFAVGILKY